MVAQYTNILESEYYIKKRFDNVGSILEGVEWGRRKE